MLSLEFLNQIGDKYQLSQEQKEVLLEKFGNDKSDLEIMDTFHISDGTLRYRMSEVYRKFHIGGKGTGKAHQLLKLLTKEYQKPHTSTLVIINPLVNNLDALVQKIRQNRHEKIQNQCGTMQILDIAQPIQIADIYTDVNVLEKISSHQWREISDLLQEFKPESKNYFCWQLKW